MIGCIVAILNLIDKLKDFWLYEPASRHELGQDENVV